MWCHSEARSRQHCHGNLTPPFPRVSVHFQISFVYHSFVVVRIEQEAIKQSVKSFFQVHSILELVHTSKIRRFCFVFIIFLCMRCAIGSLNSESSPFPSLTARAPPSPLKKQQQTNMLLTFNRRARLHLWDKYIRYINDKIETLKVDKKSLLYW